MDISNEHKEQRKAIFSKAEACQNPVADHLSFGIGID